MKTADDLYNEVNEYMERHGHELKQSSFSSQNMTYKVTTMDYTELDAKVIKYKNGQTRIFFMVDGKISSIKK